MGSVSRPDGGVMENRSVQMVRMKQTLPAVSNVFVCVGVWVCFILLTDSDYFNPNKSM